MGIGVSLILIAVGAVLEWAVTATVSGVSLDVIGWVLMGVGLAGLLITLVLADSFFGYDRRRGVD